MKDEIKKTEESRRNFIMKLSLRGGGSRHLPCPSRLLVPLELAPLLGKEEVDWVTVGAEKDFKPGTVTLVTFHKSGILRLLPVLQPIPPPG